MPQRPTRPRPIAIARVADDSAPVRLTTVERTVLNDALRRGEDLRADVEAAVTSYGRWILGAVFKDDASAALDDKSKNAVWLELVRRAGGPTLQISTRMLYVAVRVAARDKRILDQSWQGLDVGRKELLLPLATDERLREGAQHVSKWNLSQASTREYVAEVLKHGGKPRGLRLTVPRIVARVQKLRASFAGVAVLRRLGELRDEVDPAERAAAAEEIERLRAVLGAVAKTLRRK